MSEYMCPHCKKPIYDDEALSCLFCGESLERGIGVFGKIKYGASGVFCTVVLVFVLAAFCIWMIV